MGSATLSFEEFLTLNSKQRRIAYKYLSEKDKFKARITDIIGEPNSTDEERQAILLKYGINDEIG